MDDPMDKPKENVITKKRGPKPIPAIDRLMKRIVVDPASGCWIYTGSIIHNGYGTIGVPHRQRRLVHRIAYESLVGPIPEGLDLDHLCRVRSCCNPLHLEPVTRKENARRGIGMGAWKAAFQRAKTHCPQGHPYSVENTRHYRNERSCIECCRKHSRESARRLRAKMLRAKKEATA